LSTPPPIGERTVSIKPNLFDVGGYTSFEVINTCLFIDSPVIAPASLVENFILPVIAKYDAWREERKRATYEYNSHGHYVTPLMNKRCPDYLFIKLADELIKTKEAYANNTNEMA
jgi:hypothetical protein